MSYSWDIEVPSSSPSKNSRMSSLMRGELICDTVISQELIINLSHDIIMMGMMVKHFVVTQSISQWIHLPIQEDGMKYIWETFSLKFYYDEGIHKAVISFPNW